MTQKTPQKVVYRDAGDGQFVPRKYAETHPKTTEREHVPVPKHHNPKSK